MKLKEVAKFSPIERFLYWITERESIRLKKEAGKPKPWTDDEILQSYRFCNVRRMDDKVSKWLLDNWYVPYKDHPNMLVACTLARHFNKPESLRHITDFVFSDYQPERIKHTMRKLKSSGATIFNGAYMVRGIGTTDKTEMVVDKVCQPLINNPPELDFTSMQRSVEALLPYWGFSSFMAGQVIADIRWAVGGSWRDKMTWAPIGPGSKRGMNLLQELDINFPLKQEQFLVELRKLITVCEGELPSPIIGRLEAIDVQNCCCEFDKYTRVLLGEGRPKQRYNGALASV